MPKCLIPQCKTLSLILVHYVRNQHQSHNQTLFLSLIPADLRRPGLRGRDGDDLRPHRQRLAQRVQGRAGPLREGQRAPQDQGLEGKEASHRDVNKETGFRTKGSLSAQSACAKRKVNSFLPQY